MTLNPNDLEMMMQTLASIQPTQDDHSQTAGIQLLVLDIDGTIAGVSNQIRQPVKKAIAAAQAKGVQVAIATGRMYCSALRFYQEIQANLPLIVYQGALIQDPHTHKIHRHLQVPRSLALEILDHLEAPELKNLLSIHCYINDQLYVRELTPASQAYGERTGIKPLPVGDLRRHLSTEPTKILALCDNPEVVEHLLGSLRQRYTPAELYLTTSVATFVEVTHPAVNKGAAVRYLAEEVLGVPASQVMAIGDNFNDLEMISYAGIGVAMGNAPADVQAVANWVAPSVEQDGVAAAIEAFVL